MSKRLVPSMTALQCFEAAARHLSFTRAAEELHLTQSAVSKQVAQLEDMLRHHLFLRIRRRLQLTPAGSLYLAEVNKILTQVDMSSRYVLTYGEQTEILKVATQPSFGVRWLIPHLKGFGKRHTNIHLDIRNEMEPFALLQGSADVVFFYGQGTWPGAPAWSCSVRKWCRCARRSCWPGARWAMLQTWPTWCCCKALRGRRLA